MLSELIILRQAIKLAALKPMYWSLPNSDVSVLHRDHTLLLTTDVSAAHLPISGTLLREFAKPALLTHGLTRNCHPVWDAQLVSWL